MGTTKVWVFVGVSGGIEDATEVYATEAEANARYEAYAREHGVPFEEDRQDFDWSASEDYCAWTTEAEVQERAPPSAVDRARLFAADATPDGLRAVLVRAGVAEDVLEVVAWAAEAGIDVYEDMHDEPAPPEQEPCAHEGVAWDPAPNLGENTADGSILWYGTCPTCKFRVYEAYAPSGEVVADHEDPTVPADDNPAVQEVLDAARDVPEAAKVSEGFVAGPPGSGYTEYKPGTVSETLAKSHAARGGRYDARPGETREETFSRVVREAKGRLDELAAKDPAAADLIRRVLESAPPPKDDLLARCPYSGCGRELSRNGDGRIIPHDHTDDSPGGLEDRPRANY